MATTQSDTTYVSSQSNAAGSSKTSGLVDVSASYGGSIIGKITNGATGPTLACEVVIEETIDGGTRYVEVFRKKATTTADAIMPFKYSFDPDCQGLKVTFDGNTGQAVTVYAAGSRTTGI